MSEIAALMCLTTVGVACSDSAMTQGAPVVAKRALTLPIETQVLTPGGWTDSSRIHRVPDGEVAGVWNGRLQVRSMAGAVVSDFGATTSLLDTKNRGNDFTASLMSPYLGHGWIAFARWNRPAGSGNAITHDTTWWVVPPAPATSNGQTIYLFNGLQDDAGNIIQPVLQWGTSAAGGGSYWAVACWAIYSNGAGRFVGPLRSVRPGDTVVASVDSTVIDGGHFYSCHFNTPGYGQLLWYDEGHEFPQAVETLEAYNITECTDYPDTLMTAFKGISIRTHNGIPTIAWSPRDSITDCGQSVSIVSNANPGGEVDVYYHSPPPPPPPPLTVWINPVGGSNYTAEASGGSPGYTYYWEVCSFDCGGGGGDNLIQLHRVTHPQEVEGGWHYESSDQTLYWTGADWQLRVTVTDAVGAQAVATYETTAG